MFCTHCGAQFRTAPTSASAAGAKSAARPAPSRRLRRPCRHRHPLRVPPLPRRFHQLRASAAARCTRPAKCVWCGAVVDGGRSSCPRCGAALGADQMVTESGWAKCPAARTWPRCSSAIRPARSKASYVPVADINLAAGDSVYFTHHVLLWKDPQVNITAMSPRARGSACSRACR